MSLTVGQAADVNTLLRYVLSIPRPGLDSRSDAQAAAERLADAAHKRLMAGLRPADVTTAWANLRHRPEVT